MFFRAPVKGSTSLVSVGAHGLSSVFTGGSFRGTGCIFAPSSTLKNSENRNNRKYSLISIFHYWVSIQHNSQKFSLSVFSKILKNVAFSNRLSENKNFAPISLFRIKIYRMLKKNIDDQIFTPKFVFFFKSRLRIIDYSKFIAIFFKNDGWFSEWS